MRKISLNFFYVLTLIVCIGTFLLRNGQLKTVSADNSIEISAKSAYLMDCDSESLIFAKNENERLPIASMTKIMLLLLIFENEHNGSLSFDEHITVSQNASGMGGSQVFLQHGGDYKAEDLVKSIIIASANDSSVAMAERLFGSEEGAVEKMNEKAKQLNLTNTLFANCTGLPAVDQYSSAKDVAIMLKNLCNYEKYFNYSNIYLDEILHEDNRKTELTNTNKLVKFYNGCDGGKTGFTNEAGHCLACTAKRGAMRIISVVIKEPDSKTRFKDTTNMLDYAFNNFTAKAVLDSKIPLDLNVKVLNGKQQTVNVKPQKNYYVFGKKNLNENISYEFKPKDKIVAPIYKGDCVGKLLVYKNGVEIGSVNAVATEDVLQLGYWDYVKMFLAV